MTVEKTPGETFLQGVFFIKRYEIKAGRKTSGPGAR